MTSVSDTSAGVTFATRTDTSVPFRGIGHSKFVSL